MSFTPFKEVTVANPGSGTRYGSDDVLDVMKILNAKVVSNRRPEIINPWRWSSWQEIKQTAEASVSTPSEANVAHLFLSATDNKLKLKKTGGTIINLEDVGVGTWSPTGTETISNKTINVDQNTVKHSTTNTAGDLLKGSGTSFQRFTKGTANQVLAVNAAGTDLEWQVPAGGGGGGETNTASNVGSAGIGTFYQKLGVDLQFKSIFSPDASVLISDDTGNQKIDITIGGSIAKTTQANAWGDFQQTFRSTRLAISNPANTFAYFFVSSALAASRNITLPLLLGNDQLTTDGHNTTLLNKTLGTGTIANTDTVTIKHSTTNTAGELLRNTGTKFDRFAKGAASTFLRTNASGTDIEWVTPSGFGGVKLPDGTIAPTTGRWGAFDGGSGNGHGMFGFAHTYGRLHGTSTSSTESLTTIFTPSSTNAVAEFKTGCGFRRDSTCVFKAKWQLTTSVGGKIKIGLSDAATLPAGGSGSQNTRYNLSQNSSGHLEFDGSISRRSVRFDAGASGLGEAVTEVTVRFRKYGSPSGTATVGIRKNSDGTLATLGTFTPSSFGSGEQEATISAPSNSYIMLTNDRVSVEFAPNGTDGIELDENDTGTSGYTSQEWTGSWVTSNHMGMLIKCSAGGGTSGNTPLNNANGVMVHGTIGTHTNYRVARNNGTAAQTEEDSTKPLSNTTAHTLEIQINSTNCIVIIDGTTFTYTTTIPATTTAMSWFMHLETEAAAERGLSIAYAQVVVTS
jgi:hypothetical protein